MNAVRPATAQGLRLALGLLHAAGAPPWGWYRQMIRGEGLGRLIYPPVYLSLLEIFRFLYLGKQRAFAIFLAILFGYFFFSSRRSLVPALRGTVTRPHESSGAPVKVASWGSAT